MHVASARVIQSCVARARLAHRSSIYPARILCVPITAVRPCPCAVCCRTHAYARERRTRRGAKPHSLSKHQVTCRACACDTAWTPRTPFESARHVGGARHGTVAVAPMVRPASQPIRTPKCSPLPLLALLYHYYYTHAATTIVCTQFDWTNLI